MADKNTLGFHSLSDFADSLFRFKDWSITSLVAIGGALTTFITGFIWDSPSAVWTLWALMAADWVTGVYKSMRKKEFISYKLFRMPLYFIATSFLLGISWWMAKGSVMFALLPGIVIAGFYSVYFLSLAENLGEIGLLPKTLVEILKNKFGLKVLINKFFKASPEVKPETTETNETSDTPTDHV